MKIFLGTIIFLLLGITCYAQFTLSGRVVNALNEPLNGATVYLKKSDSLVAKTITESNGLFSLKLKQPLIDGELNVSYVGMNPFAKKENFAENVFFTIQLTSADIFLEPLEVSSIRAADKAPFTKINLQKASLEKLNLGQDIPFILDQTPSVTTTSDAGNGFGYTGIRIRGTDATGINVTLNGIPYNDAESQLTYFVNLPDFTSSVQSVQIERGVGTSSNGGAAFGATINLSTNEVNKTPYAESNNTYGSFNTWRNTVKLGSGLINDHFTIDARLSRITSDGYIDRAFSDLKSFYFSAAYLKDKTSVRFNLFSGKEKTYQAWYGVPESMLKTNRTFNPAGMEKPGSPYENQTDNYQQDHYQLFFNQQLSSALKMNVASFLTRGRGYYEEYKADQSFEKYGLPNVVFGNDTIKETDLIRDRWLDNYFYGQIFSVQYKNFNNEITFGGSWTKYQGKHYGNVIWAETGIEKDYQYYHLPARKNDANFYAKWMHTLGNSFTLFADMQYRNIYYEMNGFKDNPDLYIERNFNFLNPKAGISYHKNRWQAYFSYAMAHREPNRDDYEAGLNEQPTFEVLHDLELGIEKKWNSISWGLTLYHMNYHNQLVLTGQINDVGSYTRKNVPESYRTGIELSMGYKLNNYFNFHGNLAVSKNKIKRLTEYVDNWDNGKQEVFSYSNTDISFSPSLVSSLVLTIIPVKNGSISLVGKGVGKQYLDNTQNENRILNGYYRQDIKLGYTLKQVIFKEWDFILSINNIFNIKYASNGFTYPYIYQGGLITENSYYPMAGTNFLFGLNLKL